LVGGAPVTADYAEEIGVDGHAPDAAQAASLAKSPILRMCLPWGISCHSQ
jgi:5-methyltetrahydrofolate--homocysteine methyltransferase